MTEKDDTGSKNRTVFDQKCITCGTWMERTEKRHRGGLVTVTYFCPECGMSYTVDE
ncbi:MAG: hypothetical protein U9N13_02825 [Euryarchaeota archaeon]|nr:hypothetical protein [Euryarchaeota archaeon]